MQRLYTNRQSTEGKKIYKLLHVNILNASRIVICLSRTILFHSTKLWCCLLKCIVLLNLESYYCLLRKKMHATLMY